MRIRKLLPLNSFSSLLALLVPALICSTFSQGLTAKDFNPATANSSEIFNQTNIWNIHLSFTAEQWEQMEPKSGASFGGPPGGGPAGQNRGPGGPGGGPGRRGPGGPGGPGGFSPSMFLAPLFMQQADVDKDGGISKSEFTELAARWFDGSDKDKKSIIGPDELREGLNKAIMGGGGPGAPGGPGGPGGGGFTMNLQGQEGKRNGLASTMGIEFTYVHADLEFGGQTFKDVAVRYKGNGTFLESRGSNKRSFKIDLNKYSDGQHLGKISTLNLQNNITDPSWMNEVLSYRLYRDAKVPAPRTTYAKVSVTVPGKFDHTYFGLYSISENVDKHFVADNIPGKGGTVFKPVTPDLFKYLGEDWAKYKQTYDAKNTPSVSDKQRVIDFSRLVTSASDHDFEAKLGEFLDIDETARFLAVSVWLSNMDSILALGQNYYLYLDHKTQKFQFIPWDMDHSFGQFPMVGTEDQRMNLSLDKPWRGQNKFLERLFKVAAFKEKYLAVLKEDNESLFKPERFEAQVDELGRILYDTVKAEPGEKLARFEKVVSGEVVASTGFGGNQNPGPGGNGPGGMGMATKPIKPFVKARYESVKSQLTGKNSGQSLDVVASRQGGGPDFGPGTFLGPVFFREMDANKDNKLSRQEFMDGFNGWFVEWTKSQENPSVLTLESLRTGIDKKFAFPQGGPGQGRGQ
ncbi:MAG: hypothetical protein JWM04_661 [Verrucomicrobiales bacterium]|nr:hypothetical protein [Verrucomicrobiales bacterium]